MTEPWFTISGEEILQALQDVSRGLSPEYVYARIKGESARQSDWGPDSPGYDEMGQ